MWCDGGLGVKFESDNFFFFLDCESGRVMLRLSDFISFLTEGG